MMPMITKSMLAFFSVSAMRPTTTNGVAVVDVVWVAVISIIVGSACTRTLEFDTSVRPRDDMASSMRL